MSSRRSPCVPRYYQSLSKHRDDEKARIRAREDMLRDYISITKNNIAEVRTAESARALAGPTLRCQVDRCQQLYIYNIKDQSKQSLLNYCKFISWVPNSDVVVA